MSQARAIPSQEAERTQQQAERWEQIAVRLDGHLDAYRTEAAKAPARKAEGDPRVSDAARAVEAARAGRDTTSRRHKQERFALLARELGAEQARGDQFGMRTVNPHRNARDAQAIAALARAEADELRALSINDAVRLIEAQHAEQERVGQRARQLDQLERDAHRAGSNREVPAQGL